jgi:2-oxo-4-hydroxy-4-carboxy-5-ureidoimidazoline decarboxylase
MSDVLARWNRLPAEAAFKEILPCCGSRAWADGMVRRRPMSDKASLLAASDEIWRGLAESEWMAAFRSHPRIGESGIGESGTPQSAAARSADWSAQEQRTAAAADHAVRTALRQANREYERRFNHIFIVCATGKSGPEILEILRRRMENDSATELREAAEQQRQITQIRLEKWISE